MQQQKKYCPKSQAKTRTAPFGEILCLGFKADELIDFVRANTNAKGYINFDVVPRKGGADQYGNTHSVVLNEWQPKQAATNDDDSPGF